MEKLDHKDYLNFTVGPVMMDDKIRKIGEQQIPYFRTDEFSYITLESERLIKEIIKTEEKSRVIFLTASGTGAMEATVMNTLSKDDKVLVVNGGSFGHRFEELCEIHEIPHEVIRLECGHKLTKEHLEQYRDKGFTAFLVNAHETSTGVLYDLELIGEFCKEQNIFLIVDSISSFIADKYEMDKCHIDVTIIASQKAIALPPGVSIIVVNERAVKRIEENNVKSMYFNLKSYLSNGERGQTPFTPAVGILIQLNAKLKDIAEVGVETYINRSRALAEDFRNKIKELPFEIVSENLSNAVTPLKPLGKMGAHDIFEYIKDNCNIFVCPNGGELRDTLFRVGHIGDLKIEYNDKLIEVLKDMYKRGML
ncbi:pyridoxal-phosphate-dependent aminotransferase family protein [Inconstantimicrobium mannanitabidum]|uniref:Serine-pyruvate aminotransferase n=1 Tax=Inconstantimicrobium mannanitabidum TaxID=1604901 RepID=A0ACB5RFH5_9CLOT|nr:aminotransferase class V-fold PLP-dependent enzyme [Clostridium sp. TW13]GKX67821.1 serine-pyruvate aminotransferase [Clostridium sp. TW13]